MSQESVTLAQWNIRGLRPRRHPDRPGGFGPEH